MSSPPVTCTSANKKTVEAATPREQNTTQVLDSLLVIPAVVYYVLRRHNGVLLI